MTDDNFKKVLRENLTELARTQMLFNCALARLTELQQETIKVETNIEQLSEKKAQIEEKIIRFLAHEIF